MTTTKKGDNIMAKKGQYFQSYSNDLKYEVLVKHFNEFIPDTQLSKMYGIPRGTIRNWIIKCKNGEDFYTDHRSLGYGRPRVADIDYKEKYMLLKKILNFKTQLKERR